MTFLIALNALLQVLDVITTNGALANGAREGNRIVLAMMDRFGQFWWVPKLAGAGAILWAAHHNPSDLAMIALAAMAAWYGSVVWKNHLLWRK